MSAGVRLGWRWRLLVLALAGATLALAWQAGTTHAGGQAVSARKATLRTFAGTWFGHTRSLTITRRGRAKESIGNGCCDPVMDLKLRLSRPRGSSRHASVRARVTSVDVHDRSAMSRRPPRVGETRRLRLRHGVIKEPLTHTNYCNMKADLRGSCGA
jgi:hypothetical protein